MRTVYLRNGTSFYLHEELSNGRYLVEPIYLYDDFAGENVSEGGTGEMQIVTEIYNKAPVELIDAEYKMLNEKYIQLTNEYGELLTEKHKLESEVSDLEDLESAIRRDIDLDNINDKYLTDAQIQAKRERKAQQVAIDIAKQENSVKQAQDEILKLKGE